MKRLKTYFLPRFLLCIFFLASVLCLSSCVCYAQDVKFDVTVDRKKVALGSSLQLDLNFHGIQNIPAPQLPEIEGFDSRYMGPSTRMSIINTQVSTSITHTYVLIPLKEGTFTIPSLSVTYKGKTYTSREVTVEVIKSPFGGAAPADQREPQEAEDLENRVFITLKADKRKAYVNEIIPITVKLYINRLAIRDIQYPVLSHEGFSLEKFTSYEEYQETLNGTSYKVLEFKTHAFALRPGELSLGPAEIECNLLLRRRARQRRRRPSLFDDDFFDSDFFDDFFSTRLTRYPMRLKSADFPLSISPLPEHNQPDDFRGAVGNYKFFLDLYPREVKVGDPLTLKMTIVGKGNLKTVQPPSVTVGDDFKVYDPQVQQGETGKIFEQVIIPKHEGITEVPAVTFSFFDPGEGKYTTISRGPFPVTVNPLPEDEELKILDTPYGAKEIYPEKEELGRDIIFIKERPGRLRKRGAFLYYNKWFLIAQFGPLLILIGVSLFQNRKERLATDIRYARRLRAPRKARKNLAKTKEFLKTGDTNKFFDAVFKTLQEYLGDTFHLPSRGITIEVIGDLKAQGLDAALSGKLRTCFEECDRARFASATITKEQMEETFRLLQELIDTIEKKKR